ncbi:hypothetical protein KCP78_04215 [Salmonella enterica subsp. enterica]|nr:hypothetical protein KCP78_04215 [Salmonella enterica subsp. enterica]
MQPAIAFGQRVNATIGRDGVIKALPSRAGAVQVEQQHRLTFMNDTGLEASARTSKRNRPARRTKRRGYNGAGLLYQGMSKRQRNVAEKAGNMIRVQRAAEVTVKQYRRPSDAAKLVTQLLGRRWGCATGSCYEDEGNAKYASRLQLWPDGATLTRCWIRR